MKPIPVFITNIILLLILFNISYQSNLKSKQFFIPNSLLSPPPVVSISSCPCESTFKCRPCNILATPTLLPINDCPCAKCPPCPSLSLIHDLSAKRAQQDQQMASSLKGTSTQIGQLFDTLIKYSGDVITYEQEAKARAQLMEEASVKAMIARKNMIEMSEKARYIAKTSIVDRRPCVGNECIAMENIANKVFPEEISSVKDYIRGDYTTNVPIVQEVNTSSFLNNNK